MEIILHTVCTFTSGHDTLGGVCVSDQHASEVILNEGGVDGGFLQETIIHK